MLQLRGASPTNAPSTALVPIQKFNGTESTPRQDSLVVEEPLEIRVGFGPADDRRVKAVSVTMRTPGHDFELAAGFLFTEGILASADQVDRITYCGKPSTEGYLNVVRVELKSGAVVDLDRLERHFYTSSSCGVCGKTSIAAVKLGCRTRAAEGPVLDPAVVHGLPATLRGAQAVFDRTGGLHASALFDGTGQLLSLREDVGRHNALDKLIGQQFLLGRTPLNDTLLLVSGRASFELVQKAMAAGIPVLAAVGAPSTLAVDLARDCGMTLLGFVRDGRFNVYANGRRVRGTAEGTPA